MKKALISGLLTFIGLILLSGCSPSASATSPFQATPSSQYFPAVATAPASTTNLTIPPSAAPPVSQNVPVMTTVPVSIPALSLSHNILKDFEIKAEKWPALLKYYQEGYLAETSSNSESGSVILRFKNIPEFEHSKAIDTLYFGWCTNQERVGIKTLPGDYWYVYRLLPGKLDKLIRYSLEIQSRTEVALSSEGIVFIPGPQQSPVIISVNVKGDSKDKPFITEYTEGDLWLSTWADDGNLYSGWGDGSGFFKNTKAPFTDMGIARLTGDMPNISVLNVYSDPVPSDKTVAFKENDKPSSLLFLDGILYAQLHRPLEDPEVGYLAFSKDYGVTWKRLIDQSPWTKEIGSPFRCLFFINMGQNYSLNADGYVYAFGIGKEWGWRGDVYLARVKKDNILNYQAYEYYAGGKEKANGVVWSKLQSESQPLEGLTSNQQFSAIYHPEIKRYIAMTNLWIYDAPDPWGPWTISGKWLKPGWLGYQPGIITKNTGDNYFWFTESGQPVYGDELPYQLCLGKIILELND